MGFYFLPLALFLVISFSITTYLVIDVSSFMDVQSLLVIVMDIVPYIELLAGCIGYLGLEE